MAFNYAKEKREFDREWEKLRREYESAGMTTETIDKLYAFDLEWFNSRRSFINHTQGLPSETVPGEDEQERSSLIRKFASFSVALDESAMGGRYGWVEEIEDAGLSDKLRRLSRDDLELLTLITIEGYSQTETARLQGCSQKNISMKMSRIKKFLKKI